MIFHIPYPDVNECLEIDSTGKQPVYCGETETCVNKIGDYKCVPDKTVPVLIGKSLDVSSVSVNT